MKDVRDPFVTRVMPALAGLLRRFTSALVLRCLLFVAIFSLAAVPPLDPDLWWHLANGRLIVTTASIPHADVYSFSAAGQPWVMHEWLADLGMYLIYQAGGLPWLVAVFAGVVTVIGFTTAGVFSVRALASMASAIRGGGIIRVIPTIRIHPHTTAIPTTAIPTMAACTMATRITVIRTTETVILARPPPRRSKPRWHGEAIIWVRLTVCGVRRLEVQFGRFRPIKVYR